MKKYNLFMFLDDTKLGHLTVTTDNMELIFNDLSYPVMKKGFQHGTNLKQQIVICKELLTTYEKKIRHCWKLKEFEKVKIAVAFLLLWKTGNIKSEDCILIKKKSNRRRQ